MPVVAELVGTRCLGVYGRYFGGAVEVAVGEPVPVDGGTGDGEATRRGCAVSDSCDDVRFIAENWLPAGEGGSNTSPDPMSNVEFVLRSRG